MSESLSLVGVPYMVRYIDVRILWVAWDLVIYFDRCLNASMKQLYWLPSTKGFGTTLYVLLIKLVPICNGPILLYVI